MNLNSFETVFFIGIGGIGMSALALYFHSCQKNVAGYDKTPSHNTVSLQSKGIKVIFKSDIDLVEPKFLDPATTLIVTTPAVPKSNTILNFFKITFT